MQINRVTRRILSLLVVSSLIILTAPHYTSAHSQGLEWGFQEGDVFYFTSTYEFGDRRSSSTSILTALEPPEIPDPVDLPVPPRAAFQGSSGGELLYAVPIGNWSLLTSITAGSMETDTTWTWIHGGIAGSPVYTWVFSKIDGVLLSYTSRVDYDTGYSEISTVERINPFLILFTESGFVLLIVLIIFRRKRKR